MSLSDFDTVVGLSDLTSGCDTSGDTLERGLTVEVVLLVICRVCRDRERGLKRSQNGLVNKVGVVSGHLIDIGLVCDGVILVLKSLESETVVVAEGDFLIRLSEVIHREVDRIRDDSILVGTCTDSDESFGTREHRLTVVLEVLSHTVGGLLVLDTNSLMVICSCTDRGEDVITGEDTYCDLLAHDCIEVSFIVRGSHTVSDGTCRFCDGHLLGIEVIDQIVKSIRRGIIGRCGLSPHFYETA